MDEVVLQSFLLRDPDIRKRPLLFQYPNGKEAVYGNATELLLEQGVAVSFASYHNALCLTAWKKFTHIREFFLRLDIDGRFLIEVEGWNKPLVAVTQGTHRPQSLYTAEYQTKGRETLTIPVAVELSDWLALHITALDDGHFFGADWLGKTASPLTPVRLAVIFCADEQGSPVGHQASRLDMGLPEDDPISIIVVDNVGAYRHSEFKSARIRHVPNPDTGPAGGFTRGILEAMDSPSGYTHAVLTHKADISAECVRRTLALLSVLQSEYAECRLAGTLFRDESPTIPKITFEKRKKDGTYVPPGPQPDLGRWLSVLQQNYDIAGNRDAYYRYGTWAYNAIPLTRELRMELPLPLYSLESDTEFNARYGQSARRWLMLNGICAFSQPANLEGYSPEEDFFNFRNGNILRALLGGGDASFGLSAWNSFSPGALPRMYVRTLAAQAYMQGPDSLLQAPSPHQLREGYAMFLGARKKLSDKLGYFVKTSRINMNLRLNSTCYKQLWRDEAPNMTTRRFWKRFLGMNQPEQEK